MRPVRPDGTDGELGFGPEPHASSNFSAPGEEWGTSVVLDAAGCWAVQVERGQVAAELSLHVRDAAG
ncbi:hypothetical protein ACI8AG_05040 [Blastococcus sp. SYSU DS0552]